MKNRMDFPSRREHSAMLSKSSLSLDKYKKNTIGISTHRVARWERKNFIWNGRQILFAFTCTHHPSVWCIYDSWLSQLNMMGKQKKNHFHCHRHFFLRLTSIFVEAVKDIKINTRTVKRVPSLVVFARCAHERIVKFFFLPSHHGRSEVWRKKDDMSAVVQRIFSAAAEKATRQIVKFNYFHSTESPARLQLNSNRRAAETWSGSFFFVCDELARDLGPHSLANVVIILSLAPALIVE